MEFYKDTWSVLDKYFESSYFLTKHHLDSYNDFVQNKVLNTIKVLNPFVIIKKQDAANITHEINIFIGGKTGEEVFINKPTIVENGEQRLMYPNEARLKNMSYASDIFVNVTVSYTTNDNGKETVYEDIIQNVKIGSIPIMLHSSLCVLNNQPPSVLQEMGECIYDQGGYFIVDGKEKVIVAQERITTNRIFINKSKDNDENENAKTKDKAKTKASKSGTDEKEEAKANADPQAKAKAASKKYSYEGLIRCTSEENPLFPKTINLYALKNNSIKLSCPNINAHVSLFVLFRALGVESDKDIIRHIVGDIEDPMNKVMIDFLRASVLDGAAHVSDTTGPIMSQEAALKYLSHLVKYEDIDAVKHVLLNDIFPNVGTQFSNKALFFGHIIRKFIKVCLGMEKESDRDSYIFKRVDISGFLLANLFRDYYNQFRNKVRDTVDKEYLYGPWRTMKNLKTMINASNVYNIFQHKIIEEGLRKSLKGSWGVNMGDDTHDPDDVTEGLVQDLSRISYVGFI